MPEQYILINDKLWEDWPEPTNSIDEHLWKDRPRYPCSKSFADKLRASGKEGFEKGVDFQFEQERNKNDWYQVAVPVEKRSVKNQQWFTDRVNQIIWRNKTTCDCGVCESVYKTGLLLHDRSHSLYVYDLYCDYNHDGVPLEYFDTEKERDEFEQQLTNK